MDHLGGDDDGGVAGDVEHPAPAAGGHARQVGADQPRRGQHVDLEVAPPVVVADLEGGLGAEDAQVVDQHVDVGLARGELGGALGRRDVGDHADDLAAGLVAQVRDGAVHPRLGPPVDHHPGAGAGEIGGDGPADAARRAGDQGRPSGQVELHGSSSRS